MKTCQQSVLKLLNQTFFCSKINLFYAITEYIVEIADCLQFLTCIRKTGMCERVCEIKKQVEAVANNLNGSGLSALWIPNPVRSQKLSGYGLVSTWIGDRGNTRMPGKWCVSEWLVVVRGANEVEWQSCFYPSIPGELWLQQ